MTTNDIKRPTPFVHLHVHSEYSILDATINIDKLIERAKSWGHTHVALTDHGNMFGALDFYIKAKKAGITPILGCEIYHAATFDFGDLPGTAIGTAGSYHLVLLAKNYDGYRELINLVSSGYITKDLGAVPVIALKKIIKTSNLIVLSSCLRGEFGVLVQKLCSLHTDSEKLQLQIDDSDIGHICSALKQHAQKMQETFNNNYYIELIDNNLLEQQKILPHLVSVADWLGLPIVATADAHYLDRDFSDTHTIAIAIKNGLTLRDFPQRLKTAEFHLFTADDMFKRYNKWPQAIANTLKIANECHHIDIPMGKYYLPKISLAGITPQVSLKNSTYAGLNTRLPAIKKYYGKLFDDKKQREYQQRINYELDVINQMGFPDYFLIVADFVGWAKKQRIPVGPGRGSGAGSLVAYCLNITDLDPIPYNLIFERFLNPERISMPDFDIDFCQWRREEVVQYCISKYGSSQVAQITTFGKMLAKAAVKAVGRAMNISYKRMDNFTKLIPPDLGITLQAALTQEPQLKQEMSKDEELKECMEHALRLEGLVSHTSVHAAGLVISDGLMTDFLPIYTTDGKSLITQFEMKPTEKVGLVKFDFLGLKTLTVIDKTIEFIHTIGDSNFNIIEIPLDDKKVFQQLSAGNTVGVFQCESPGMTNLILKLKPSSFEDIIALVALFRPGPLGSGMVDDFIERKHGRQKIVYLEANLKSILQETYGMILYQEQVQKIASILADYSLGEADILRRAMGKKDPQEMAQQKDRFLTGALKNGLIVERAESIFELMAEFAKYGFNKSHSAAYGLLSYQTAFLKTYYPEHFMAALMTCDMDNTDKITKYVDDLHKLKIKLLPPDINSSQVNFYVPSKKHIRFSLEAIKGIGEAMVAPIIAERIKKGTFSSLSQLAKRVPLQLIGKKSLQVLAQVGALDCFGIKRHKLEQIIPSLVEFSISWHTAQNQGQRGLFDLASKDANTKDEWSHPHLLATDNQRLWNYEHLIIEKKLTGAFISCHPFKLFNRDWCEFGKVLIKDFNSILGNEKNKTINIVAWLVVANFRRAKNGNMMASLRLEQNNTLIEAMVFSKALEQVTIPPLNTLVRVTGNLGKDYSGHSLRFFVEEIYAVEEYRQTEVGELVLKITNDKCSLELISTIKRLLTQHSGPTPVSFELDFAEGVACITQTSLKVSLSNALLIDLEAITSSTIELKYL